MTFWANLFELTLTVIFLLWLYIIFHHLILSWALLDSIIPCVLAREGAEEFIAEMPNDIYSENGSQKKAFCRL